MAEDDNSVGKRIMAKGFTGIIKYVGDVKGTTGTWYGIEWDDISRGKHNGTYNGIEYFKAKSQVSGSFIRLPSINKSVEFYEAIKSKYGAMQKDEVDNLNKDLYVKGEIDNTTKVHLVGMQSVNSQQSVLSDLRVVSVQSKSVSRVSPQRLIEMNKVIEVDLSNNLFSNFDDILQIVDTLPSLEILVLSGNRISSYTSASKGSYEKVKNLYLNNMDLQWNQIMEITKFFNKLVDLQVISNRIEKLPISLAVDNKLQFLEKLSLQNNKIQQWNEINSLGSLPCLKELILDECSLTSVVYDDKAVPASFHVLEHMSLSRNKLTDLATMNELSRFPALTHVQLTGNTFTCDLTYDLTDGPTEDRIIDDATAFNCAVSKCVRLVRLNKTSLTAKIRREAEVFYVNRYGQTYLKAMSSEGTIAMTKFMTRHPSWNSLLKIHGAPSHGELSEKKFTVINDSLIGNLVNMLINKTLYKADLTYTSSQMKGIHFDLDDDYKDIGYYCMESGDVIHVK